MIAPALAGGCLIAACAADPPAGPEVTASFITPEYFHLAISGSDAAEAPNLRQLWHAEVARYARAQGCIGYRVIKETFITAANVSPAVTLDPVAVYGRRPTYVGVVDCELPTVPGYAQTFGRPR